MGRSVGRESNPSLGCLFGTIAGRLSESDRIDEKASGTGTNVPCCPLTLVEERASRNRLRRE